MNKLIIILLISLLFHSCSEEVEDAELPMEFEVKSYSSVQVDGQVKVVFHNMNDSHSGGRMLHTGEFMVYIQSTESQRREIKVKSEGDVLYIAAGSSISLDDSVKIKLYTLDLIEIRLEADQIAEFTGSFDQESLTFVTEANSKLILSGTRIKHLTARTGAESMFTFSNWSGQVQGDLTYPESEGVLLNDSTLLLIHQSLILTGDSIRLDQAETNNWLVYGNTINQFYQMASCDFVTQGETSIHAGRAASSVVNINLEGTSTAEVWAVDELTGKAEGLSVLGYYGSPDVSSYILQGDAQLIAFE